MNQLFLRRCATSVVWVSLALLAGCDMFTSTDARLARAEQHVMSGDYQGALIELKNVIQKEPNNGRAHVQLAKVALKLGDRDTVDHELKLAVKSGIAPAEVAELTAQAHVAASRAKELLELIDSGQLVLPEPQRSLYRGQALNGLGRSDEAKLAFEAALAADPQLAEAELGWAQSRVGAGDIKAALERLQELTQRRPDFAAGWLTYGILLVQTRELETATKALSTAREKAPGQLTATQQGYLLTELANVHLARQDFPAATATLNELQQVAPDAPTTRMVTARIAMTNKDYAAATSELQRLVQTSPDFLPGRVLLAVALTAQNNLEQAAIQLGQVVERAPDNLVARSMLAEVQTKLGRPQAVTSALTPSDPTKIIGEYEKMLERRPDNPVALNNLAIMYAQIKDPRALETARKAYSLEPKAPAIADTYGWLLVENGQIDEGLKLLEAAAAASDNPEIDAHYEAAKRRVKQK